jgi:hypothetical protein
MICISLRDNISLGLRLLVLFHVGVRIHELSSFMFVSDGRPILGSMVLVYKAWAQWLMEKKQGQKPRF